MANTRSPSVSVAGTVIAATTHNVTDEKTKQNLRTAIFATDIGDTFATAGFFSFFLKGLQSEWVKAYENSGVYFTSLGGNLITLTRSVLHTSLAYINYRSLGKKKPADAHGWLETNISRAIVENLVHVPLATFSWLANFAKVGAIVSAAPFIFTIALGVKALYFLGTTSYYLYRAYQAWRDPKKNAQAVKDELARAAIQFAVFLILATLTAAIATLFIVGAPVTLPTLGGLSIISILGNVGTFAGGILTLWAYFRKPAQKDISSERPQVEADSYDDPHQRAAWLHDDSNSTPTVDAYFADTADTNVAVSTASSPNISSNKADALPVLDGAPATSNAVIFTPPPPGIVTQCGVFARKSATTKMQKSSTPVYPSLRPTFSANPAAAAAAA